MGVSVPGNPDAGEEPALSPLPPSSALLSGVISPRMIQQAWEVVRGTSGRGIATGKGGG